MFSKTFNKAEKRYTYIKYFCFPKVIIIHCRKLVVKKNGKDKSNILKGIMDWEKSAFIKVNKGETNQNGIRMTKENPKNTKKYFFINELNLFTSVLA